MTGSNYKAKYLALLIVCLPLSSCTSDEEMRDIKSCVDGFYSAGYKDKSGKQLTWENDGGLRLQIIDACTAKVEMFNDGRPVLPWLNKEDIEKYYISLRATSNLESTANKFKALYPTKSDKTNYESERKKLHAINEKNNAKSTKKKNEKIETDIYSEDKVKKLKEKAAKSDKETQFLIGIAFLHGYKVKKDIKEGVYWLEKAAERGYVKAISKLGIIYLAGNVLKQDYKKALIYLKKAARLKDSQSQFMLANMYRYGWGLKEDNSKFVYWLKESAKLNDANGQLILGEWYFENNDIENAIKWLKKSSEQGKQEAWISLSKVYIQKAREESNADESIRLHKEAFKWIYVAKQLGDYDDEQLKRVDIGYKVLSTFFAMSNEDLREAKMFTSKLKGKLNKLKP